MTETFNSLPELLQFHAARYVNMQAQDMYKMLYQAAMGAEHLLTDERAAKDWLHQECAHIHEPLPHEKLCEPVSVHGDIVRLNLRPAKLQLTEQQMWDVFYQSAQHVQPNLPIFKSYWQEFLSLCERQVFADMFVDVLDFHQQILQRHYPVMHHSEMYRQHYKPAYRIININFLKQYGVMSD